MQKLTAKNKNPVQLPKRPDLPTLEQLIEDIANAPDDDVLFTLSSQLALDAGPELVNASDSLQNEKILDATAPSNSVDEVFAQAAGLCILNKKLQDAPEQLKNALADLDVQAAEIQQHLDKLNDIAQNKA